MALVTGLYVAVTLVLSVISFGAIQIRLSEMFNYLSLYNKKYIYAVTLGVALANLASPLGLVDVVVGSVSTLIVLLLNYSVTKRSKKYKTENGDYNAYFCILHVDSGRTVKIIVSSTLFL